ncbi:MAG: chromosomal replication initiator protein DnaA [Kiritimatiellia bacterium]
MSEAERLWSDALVELSAALSEVTVRNFFGECHGLALSDGVLKVGIEGQNGALLHQQFGSFIENALLHAGAIEGTRVEFVEAEQSTGQTHSIRLLAAPVENSSSLISRFTFETFVVGPSNQFPVAMAKYVAQHPGDESNRTNPLFMYGPTGVGKTHLLHAIGNLAVEQNHQIRVLYTTSENLMNEYIGSWNTEERKETFRKKYRTPDMLFVDDIQYLAGKKGLQDEFFAIFNELKDHNKQIVMTSDRAPKDIPDLMERLMSRFQSGVCADVDMPMYETRLNILRLKLKSYPSVVLSDAVLDFIAQKVSSSVRALEGALSCTINYARCFPGGSTENITVEVLEKSILKDFITQEESISKLSCSDIQKAVCDFYSVKLEDVLGAAKMREIVIPRQIAIFLCRKLTASSTTDIGRAFSRNHSTILYSCSTVQGLLKSNDSTTVSTLKTLVGTLGRTLSDLN